MSQLLIFNEATGVVEIFNICWYWCLILLWYGMLCYALLSNYSHRSLSKFSVPKSLTVKERRLDAFNNIFPNFFFSCKHLQVFFSALSNSYRWHALKKKWKPSSSFQLPSAIGDLL